MCGELYKNISLQVIYTGERVKGTAVTLDYRIGQA